MLAPFLVFAVTGLFQWALIGIVPADALASLADASAPYADGMQLAGIVGFPLVLLCLGIAFGGDFSTLNASVSAPARYLYTMAKDGALPAFLEKLHPRFQTPVPAILLLGGLMLFLIATNSIAVIASLSLFATLLYYVIGMAAACGLRIRKPGLKRPYRAPLLWVGAPVSIGVYLLLMTQLDCAAVLAGILWCLIGLVLFFICRRVRKPAADSLSPPPPRSAAGRTGKTEDGPGVPHLVRRGGGGGFAGAGPASFSFSLTHIVPPFCIGMKKGPAAMHAAGPFSNTTGGSGT